MSNPYFQFKKFVVYHDRCAMKVGTDAVLLGAWANIDGVESCLDVGTGTGLISLIIAQRGNDQINIDAIDIDSDAILQAKENVMRSPFNNVMCHHFAFAKYTSSKLYDLIISNPPYFTSSLHSANEQRTMARHADSLNIADYIEQSSLLLSAKGRIALIFPFSSKNELLTLADKNNLFVSRVTNVYPTPKSLPKRVLFEFSKKAGIYTETNLTIEVERHSYSPEFKSLVKPFYLTIT